MRPWYCLLLFAAIQPACALAAEAPYYGPMKAWHGIGYQFGYKEEPQRNGSWRVVANTQSGEAIDMAMYRAAQLAREQGFAYVQFLDGWASRSPGIRSAGVYVRFSDTPAPPTTCRSKRADTCYTATATDVLRKLGGAGGTQAGVPVIDHRDQYGRPVYRSGFGIGQAVPGGSLPPPISAVKRPQLADGNLKPDPAPATPQR